MSFFFAPRVASKSAESGRNTLYVHYSEADMGRRAKGTGALTKLSSGRWRARTATGEVGRFRYATFALKSKADAWLRESTSVEPTAQKGTFAAVAQAWLETQRGRVESAELAPSTWDQYRIMIEKHLVPAIGPSDLAELDAKTVKTVALADTKQVWLKNGNGTKTVAWGSLSKRRAVLHAVFAYAVEEGIVKSNPVAGVLRQRNVRERANRSA